MTCSVCILLFGVYTPRREERRGGVYLNKLMGADNVQHISICHCSDLAFTGLSSSAYMVLLPAGVQAQDQDWCVCSD